MLGKTNVEVFLTVKRKSTSQFEEFEALKNKWL